MKKTSPQSFKEALIELENIAEKFEAGDLDVEKGLKDYERGLELAAFCKKKLANLEVRVKEIQSKHLI
ncbi:MAG: exodeoxyribonuclease VII small subunit [Patescibacteria group bacterium]